MPEENEIIESQEDSEEKAEKKTTKQVAVGTILGYISVALSIISGLVFTPWVIETIGSSGHGIYTLTTSLVSIFLLDFGLGSTANTFLARYRAKKDIDGERHFLGILYKAYLAIDIGILIAFVVVYFLIPYIYQGLTPEEIEQTKVAFVILGAYSVIAFPTSIFNGVISAYEEFIWSKILDIANRVIYITLTVLALTLGWGLYGLVASNCLAHIVIIVAKYLLMRGKLKVKADFKWKAPPGFFKSVIAFSGWAMISSIAARMMWNIAPSVLGIVSDSGNISALGVVSSLESIFYSLGTVMSGMLLPKIARMINDPNSTRRSIDDFAIKITKIQITILLLVFVGFIAIGQDFIDFWLARTNKTGEEYKYVNLSLCLVVSSGIIKISETVYDNEMYVKNKVKYIAISDLVMAIINVGLLFLFGYFWGSLGACIAIMTSSLVSAILRAYFYKKQLGAGILRFFAKVYVPFLLPSLASLGVGLLIHFLVPLEPLYVLIIGVLAMTAVYVPLCIFFSYSKAERKGLIALLKRSE